MTELTPETLAEWRERYAHTCPGVDAETDAADCIITALLDALADEQRIRVEITRTLVNPANCKVWRDGVLVFDGVSLDALAAEKAAREEAEEAHRQTDTAWQEQNRLDVQVEKARADKAERERDDLKEIAYDQHGEAYRDRFRNQMQAATETLARVAALEAGVNALIDMHDQRGKRINPNDLRDLTEKGD